MKKIHFIILTIFLAWLGNYSTSFAQLRIGVSGGYAIPIGNFGSIEENSFGASLSGKYKINERFSITASFNYYAFGRSDESLGDLVEGFGISEGTVALLETLGLDTLLTTPNIDFFPVNVGFEYYPFIKGKLRPYVGFDVGLYTTHTQTISLDLNQLVVAFFEQTGQTPPPVSLGSIDLTASDANFGLAAVLGIRYVISDRWSIDAFSKANGIFFLNRDSLPTVITFGIGGFYNLKK